MTTGTTARVRLIEMRPEHDSILNSIIASARGGDFTQLPPEAAEQVLSMQVSAQRAGYQSSFPDAIDRLIVADDGTMVGRMLHQRTADHIRLIDIAVLPAHRGRGYGSAALRDLCAGADALRLDLRLSVHATATGVRDWYRRSGFQDAGATTTQTSMIRPAAQETP